jgi:hypothetical protein
MILSYVDLLGDGERHEIAAAITTDHALSSYSQPVILLDDGAPLDMTSWVLLGYQVVEATPQEIELLKKLKWKVERRKRSLTKREPDLKLRA